MLLLLMIERGPQAAPGLPGNNLLQLVATNIRCRPSLLSNHSGLAKRIIR